ncbi:hypothetical protein WDW89_11535 [Deltaproteobacteria bacterium TL4]
MNRFNELKDAYNTYLENTKNYHIECARLLDKFRYQLLAYLECDQDALMFRSIDNGNEKFIKLGPQAHPIMQFGGEDGYWHIAMVLELPQQDDPKQKGKVWFQILIKKPTLKARNFLIRINLKPPVEAKIPDKMNEEKLNELCEFVFVQAKEFYETAFQSLLAKSITSKTIGFHISE